MLKNIETRLDGDGLSGTLLHREHLIRRFSTNHALTRPFRWFAVVMGTGVVSVLLHNLPYNGTWLYWISVIIFALNVILFISFLFISILRYTIYPEIWVAMIRHPAQSLFIGTFPVGLSTIINMIVFVCVPAWGYRFVQLVSFKDLRSSTE